MGMRYGVLRWREMGDKTYHSVQEFEEAMFPEEARRKKLEAMSAGELGKFLAQEAIERIRIQLLERRGDG